VNKLIEPVLQLTHLGGDAGAIGAKRSAIQLSHQLALPDYLAFLHRHGDDELVRGGGNLKSMSFDGPHGGHMGVATAGRCRQQSAQKQVPV
jgi:hypothetical protein